MDGFKMVNTKVITTLITLKLQQSCIQLHHVSYRGMDLFIVRATGEGQVSTSQHHFGAIDWNESAKKSGHPKRPESLLIISATCHCQTGFKLVQNRFKLEPSHFSYLNYEIELYFVVKYHNAGEDHAF